MYMFKVINKVTRIMNLHLLLRLILCVQLCLSPYYTYSAEGDGSDDASRPASDANDNSLKDADTTGDPIQDSIREAFAKFSREGVDPFQEVLETTEADLVEEGKKSPELKIKEKIDIINAISSAMDTGTLKQYLDEYPEVRKKSENIFLFADQTMESITYRFDSKNNTVITETTEPIRLNDYKSHPIPVFFKPEDVRVRYNEESKELLFEATRKYLLGGEEQERVAVRYRVSNMHIVDYAQDGELLVLVDANKGLLLVNMVFVRAYLSRAPIPFTTVSVPVLRHLKEQSSLDQERGKVTVELYKTGVRVPDTVPEYVDNLQKTFEGRSLITQGDLMVSYTDSNNQKHLVQFLKRTEMAGWLRMDFKVLDVMVKTVAPYIMTEEEIKLFSEEKKEIVDFFEKKGGTQKADPVERYTLSALFSRGSVQKMIQAKEGLSYIIDEQLKKLQDERNVTNRQIDVLEEIRDNLNGALEQIEERIEERPPVQDEVERSSVEEQNDKKVELRSKALRFISAIHNNSSKKIGSFIKENKVELGVGTLLAIPALYFFVKNLLYVDGMVFYSATTLPHLLAVGAVLPVFLILAAKTYIPIVKGIQKKLPTNRMQNFIDKWEGASWAHRLSGSAVKVVYISMLGLWVWMFRAMGKPHFFTSLHKKLNPIKKIPVDSDVGQVAGIKKDTRLGLSGWQWRKKSEDFIQSEHLLDVTEEKQMRIHLISWLMATLAVSKKEGVSAIDSLIYGVGGFDLQELARMKKDHALQMEAVWVMKHLKKEIEKLNEIDMRTEITDLDPALLEKIYERAQKRVQDFRSASYLRKRMRSMKYTSARLIKQTPLVNLHPRNVLTQNMDDIKRLENVPSDLVADRLITEFMMDHLVVILLPLIATERAAFNLEHFTNDLSLYANKFLLTGEAHLQDVWLNVMVHFLVAGGQRSLQLTGNPFIVRDIALKYTDIYESSAKDLYPIIGVKNSFFRELKTSLSYLAMTGKPDKSMNYPASFSNFGDTFWNEWKTRMKTWQLGIGLFISLRLALSSQTLEEAFFAALMLNLAGGTINGFWMWLGRSQQMSEAILKDNKKRMEQLRNKLYRIKQVLYESEETLRTDYREALLEMVNLYRSKSQRKKLLEAIGPINSMLSTYIINNVQREASGELPLLQNRETIQETSERLLVLISQDPPLPTEAPEIARKIMAFIFGGIVTTIIGVKLITYTFDKNYLNWETIGILAGISFSIYTALFWAYHENFKKWRNSASRNEGIKGQGRLLEIWSRDWKTYFYGKTLGFGRGMKNICRRAFRSTKKE